jgi:hypothetical protein
LFDDLLLRQASGLHRRNVLTGAEKTGNGGEEEGGSQFHGCSWADEGRQYSSIANRDTHLVERVDLQSK